MGSTWHARCELGRAGQPGRAAAAAVAASGSHCWSGTSLGSGSYIRNHHVGILLARSLLAGWRRQLRRPAAQRDPSRVSYSPITMLSFQGRNAMQPTLERPPGTCLSGAAPFVKTLLLQTVIFQSALPIGCENSRTQLPHRCCLLGDLLLCPLAVSKASLRPQILSGDALDRPP